MPFVWSMREQEAFEELRQRLTSAPILGHPDFGKPFVLYADASQQAVGAALAQKTDKGEQVSDSVSEPEVFVSHAQP